MIFERERTRRFHAQCGGVRGAKDFRLDALEAGTLARVLDAYPPTTRPIHTLYPRNRHLLPKVSVFLDFVSELFRSRAAPT